MRILQVAPAIAGGGGEQIALRLHRAFRRRGHRSMLFAGRLSGAQEEDVFPIPGRWEVSSRARTVNAFFQRVITLTGGRGRTRLFPLFEALAFPRVAWDLALGHEDYTQPGSSQILSLAPEPPDVVLLHNLHGQWLRREGFFDLEYLPALSRAVPVILFPQDPWLITGHCAHPIDCPRWRIGCGRCPDLKIYPAIRRDATAGNFRRKRAIFARSSLHLAAPSEWLLTMFAEARIPLRSSREIANGVDTALFQPGDRSAARAALGLDPNRRIVLVSGNFLRTNPWKGYAWLADAVESLGWMKGLPPADFVCVGDEGETIVRGGVRIVFAGKVADPAQMAEYYRAADVCFHPSRADTAPFSVLEAMASGLPVVATSVGGIPEQVEEGESGFLVPPGDSRAMAARLSELLLDPALAEEMGAQGRARVLERFDFERQVGSFIDGMRKISH